MNCGHAHRGITRVWLQGSTTYIIMVGKGMAKQHRVNFGEGPGAVAKVSVRRDCQS